MKLSYNPAIDGLRAISVLAVIAYHAGFGWAAGGYLGVEVFFVISGFLVVALMVDEQVSSGRFEMGQFWLRRARRLLPAVVFLLVVVAIVVPRVWPADSDRLPGQVASAAGYVANWQQIAASASYFDEWSRPPVLRHLWSLAVEEQFYLVWPLCVALLGARALGRLAFALIGAALVARIALQLAGAPELAPYMFTFARMDALAVGAVFALVARDAGALARVRPWLAPTAWISTAGLLVIAAVTKGFYQNVPIVQTLGYSLLAVVSGIVVLASALPASGSSTLARLFSARSLRALGKYSYGLYVFHVPIIELLRPRAQWTINHGSTAHRLVALGTFVLVVSVLSIATAVASYELLERRCLALKRFFVARPVVYGASEHSGNG